MQGTLEMIAIILVLIYLLAVTVFMIVLTIEVIKSDMEIKSDLDPHPNYLDFIKKLAKVQKRKEVKNGRLHCCSRK